MEYPRRTYFAEHEEESVKGFTIIKAQDGKYHLAEKWRRDGAEDKWIQYWITEEELLARVEDDKCEAKAKISPEQFKQVCEFVGFYEEEAEKVSA